METDGQSIFVTRSGLLINASQEGQVAMTEISSSVTSTSAIRASTLTAVLIPGLDYLPFVQLLAAVDIEPEQAPAVAAEVEGFHRPSR